MKEIHSEIMKNKFVIFLKLRFLSKIHNIILMMLSVEISNI